MSEKIRYKRTAAIVVFVLFISIVLVFTGKIVRAKFIGDSTTIVNGFYTEKKNDIKRCLTPRPNIKKNLFTSEFNVETDLQNAKLLSNSKKKYNFAVFELEESVQKKMGLKYLITPVKEKIDKSFVKEELKSIHQKYDDVYYLPYTEQLSEKIIQKNSRITFGKIDFDNISNE